MRFGNASTAPARSYTKLASALLAVGLVAVAVVLPATWAHAQPVYKGTSQPRPPAAPAAATVAGVSDDSTVKSKSKPTEPLDPRAVVVKLNDGGVLKMLLVDDAIEIAGRYGTLHIAPPDILRIEFATRIPADTQQQIEKAIAELGSTEPTVRAAAAQRLIATGDVAYPYVLKAAESADSPASKPAAAVLEKIKEAVDEADLSPRTTDVIYTSDSTITGRIVAAALKVRTSQFGELSLKVTDIRSLRSQSLPEEKAEPEIGDALPDPGTLSNYHGQIGQTIRFRITGTIDGALWGSGVYTTDSKLSTAAVHAGAIKADQTGAVTVRIVQGLAGYAGSVSNGVTSNGYGAYPVAYVFVTKKRR